MENLHGILQFVGYASAWHLMSTENNKGVGKLKPSYQLLVAEASQTRTSKSSYWRLWEA